MIKTKAKFNSWSTVSWLAILLPVAGYLVMDAIFGGSASGNDARRLISGVLIIITSIALLICFVASIKLRGKKKALPIIGIIPLAAVEYAVLFTYAFSFYS